MLLNLNWGEREKADPTFLAQDWGNHKNQFRSYQSFFSLFVHLFKVD